MALADGEPGVENNPIIARQGLTHPDCPPVERASDPVPHAGRNLAVPKQAWENAGPDNPTVWEPLPGESKADLHLLAKLVLGHIIENII